MIWKIEAFELFSVFRFGYPCICCSFNFLIGTTTRVVPHDIFLFLYNGLATRR